MVESSIKPLHEVVLVCAVTLSETQHAHSPMTNPAASLAIMVGDLQGSLNSCMWEPSYKSSARWRHRTSSFSESYVCSSTASSRLSRRSLQKLRQRECVRSMGSSCRASQSRRNSKMATPFGATSWTPVSSESNQRICLSAVAIFRKRTR